MIKILLKHNLIESAINHLFKGLINTFAININTDYQNAKTGDKFQFVKMINYFHETQQLTNLHYNTNFYYNKIIVICHDFIITQTITDLNGDITWIICADYTIFQYWNNQSLVNEEVTRNNKKNNYYIYKATCIDVKNITKIK